MDEFFLQQATDWDDATGLLAFADYLDDSGGSQAESAIVRWAANTSSEQVFQWIARLSEIGDLYPNGCPFVHDNWLYVTDEKIAIRVRTIAPDTCRNPNTKLGADISRVTTAFQHFVGGSYNWPSHSTGSYYPVWQHWPKDAIETSAEPQQETCDCPICLTEGIIFISAEESRCVYCDGAGFVERFESPETGDYRWGGKYWKRISQLPNVMYREATQVTGMPIWFRFFGGEGLLASITPKESHSLLDFKYS